MDLSLRFLAGDRSDDCRDRYRQSLAPELRPRVFQPVWTGIDLFMGFVLGPIFKRVDLPVRREIVRRLTPRTLFLMPAVSIISGTTGWFLAVALGYTSFDWPVGLPRRSDWSR